MTFDKKTKKIECKKSVSQSEGGRFSQKRKGTYALLGGENEKLQQNDIVARSRLPLFFFCWDELDATKAMLIVPLSIAVNKIRLESRVE